MPSNPAMNSLLMQQAILMQYNMLQQQQQQQQGMMLPIQNQANNNQLAQMMMMQGQGINGTLGAPQVFPNVQMPAIQPVENGVALNKEEESTPTKVGQTESV